MQILIERMLNDLQLIIFSKVRKLEKMGSLQQEARYSIHQVSMISKKYIEKWLWGHWNSKEDNSKYAEFNSDIVNFRLLFRFHID